MIPDNTLNLKLAQGEKEERRERKEKKNWTREEFKQPRSVRKTSQSGAVTQSALTSQGGAASSLAGWRDSRSVEAAAVVGVDQRGAPR